MFCQVLDKKKMHWNSFTEYSVLYKLLVFLSIYCNVIASLHFSDFCSTSYRILCEIAETTVFVLRVFTQFNVKREQIV